MDFLKRILIIALCSVLLVCACPTFSTHSEAAEAALTTEFLRSAIGYLSGYLVSKGYSISQNLEFDYDLLDETLDHSILYQFYKSYFDTLSAASETYSSLFESALKRAVNTGVFSVSEDVDQFMTQYFETLNIDGSLILGTSKVTFEPFDAGTPFSFNGSYQVTNDPGLYNFNISITPTYDYLPLININVSDSTIRSIDVLLLPVTAVVSSSGVDFHTTYSNNHPDNLQAYTVNEGLRTISSNGVYYRCYGFNIVYQYTSTYIPGGFDLPDVLTTFNDTLSSYFPIISFLRTNGYYEDTSDFTSEQIEDTSNKNILSSASEVDPETGAVSGGFTMYMRDWSLFQQILRQFSSGILSWTQAIKALGLSQVSVDATPAEKESALDKVAYPDSTYDWFTTTDWDNGLTQTVKDEVATAHETELDIADELAETINGGNDPSDEDKNKAGNAMLLATLLMYLGLWDPPGFDPEDTQTPGIGDTPTTDPTNRGMLVETLTGMAVAGGFIDDLWDSVGGSQGLGIIFTVGASFVVFSVIIGGSNYLGSLQSPDVSNNIDISKERSRIPQNNVPLLTTSKKSRRRK